MVVSHPTTSLTRPTPPATDGLKRAVPRTWAPQRMSGQVATDEMNQAKMRPAAMTRAVKAHVAIRRKPAARPARTFGRVSSVVELSSAVERYRAPQMRRAVAVLRQEQHHADYR